MSNRHPPPYIQNPTTYNYNDLYYWRSAYLPHDDPSKDWLFSAEPPIGRIQPNTKRGVADPSKYLIIAIIACAHDDLNSRNDIHRTSAELFLNSDIYADFLDWLQIPNTK